MTAIEGFKLSPQQSRQWRLISQTQPGNYRVCCDIRLDGPLDRERFERALDTLILRHDILRTTYQTLAGLEFPLQVISDGVTKHVTFLDLNDLTEAERTARLAASKATLATMALDLENGPILHANLIALDQTRHQLLLMLPGLSCDGIGLNNLLVDLIDLYWKDSAVFDEAVSYAAVSQWQHTILESEEAEPGRRFWRAQEAFQFVYKPLAIETLLTDESAFAPATVTAPLDAKHCKLLEATFSNLENGMVTVLLASWKILLWRLLGREDIVVGTSYSGRFDEDLEELPGLFCKYLPISTTLAQGQRPEDLFEQVEIVWRDQGEWLECFSWEILSGVRSYFPYCFESQKLLSLEAELTLQVERLDACLERFKLKLSCAQHQQGIHVTLHYDASRINEVDAHRTLEQYLTLLASIAEKPTAALIEHNLVGEQELHLLLTSFNTPAAIGHLDRLLQQDFEKLAAEQPKVAALFWDDKVFSYADVDRQSNQMAHHLQTLGVGPETRVGVFLELGSNMVTALFGILKAGGTYVPLDPGYPQARIAFILDDSRINVILTQQTLLEQLPVHDATAVCMDRDAHKIEQHEVMAPPCKAIGANPAYMIYTSGSTGNPKGVVIPHQNAVHSTRERFNSYPESPGAFLLLSSFAFDSSVVGIFWPLSAGGSLHLPSAEIFHDPTLLSDFLACHQITHMLAVPTLYTQILEQSEPRKLNLLKAVIVAGEACPENLIALHGRTLPQAALYNEYGPTEGTVWSTLATLWPNPTRVGVPIGKPIGNVQIYLLDSAMRQVPVGVIGEIFIGGLGLARAYHDRAQLTAKVFVPNPWATQPGTRLYKTGDLARYQPDGNIDFRGRRDEQVKIFGYRIELGEIETMLSGLEGVREAVVLVREDVAGNRRLVGYATPEAGRKLIEAELTQRLAQLLPGFMVPSFLVVLEKMPLTPNGKIDRKKLPDVNLSDLIKRDYAAPRNETEAKLALIWADVLGLEKIGIHHNIFEVGGNSLLTIKAHSRIDEALQKSIPVTDFFRYPTIAKLAEHLASLGDPHEKAEDILFPELDPEHLEGTGDIALIGMAGRFPGSANVTEFWNNLKNAVNSICYFSEAQLLEAGVAAEQVQDPYFVKARSEPDNIDMFDAAFFEFTPREAEITDPQQRFLMECAYDALEDCGYPSALQPGPVGIFAGVGISNYWLENLIFRADLVQSLGARQVMMGNMGDFAITKIAYKLNLTGPALNINTACSTSLVATHLACRSLLARECLMALAGGATLGLSKVGGYFYQEGGILSPDGYCRAFDAEARGVVGGGGAAMVVLKRLSDAQRDRDHIYAVIKGSAVNNDGLDKVGYTAPGIRGQAGVIKRAHALAGVTPDSIGYVEAHGTGTPLGDPIEVAALTEAFGPRNGEVPHCGLGSVKTNIGHLDTAAGVTGLIKAALCVKYGLIPASLNYQSPNPSINFDSSPFYVNSSTKIWTGSGPRRAGVSSFGIGGTNAHVVLEEPPVCDRDEARRKWQVLVLSAQSEAALDQAAINLSTFLEEHSDTSLADVAFTLQHGRQAFRHRRAWVCSSVAEAARCLQGKAPAASKGNLAQSKLVFMFSGQGAQYSGMTRDLYDNEPVYREALELCAQILDQHLDLNLLDLLFKATDPAQLAQTQYAQPALFSVEYAMAKLLESLSIRAEAMIGHSVGEYVAACLAGVFSLEDGLELVAQRGKLMSEMATGSMIAVSLGEERLEPYLNSSISVAAVNGPDRTVLSGSEAAIDSVAKLLRHDKVSVMPLHTSHAFHSHMMEPICDAFGQLLERIKLKRPHKVFLSNLTGTWITEEEASSPAYWVHHLREPVRFYDGLKAVETLHPNCLFLEVGPGNTLVYLAEGGGMRGRCAALGRHPKNSGDDQASFLQGLASLWTMGLSFSWQTLHEGEKRGRLSLPSYAYQRSSYWVSPGQVPAIASRPSQSGELLYEPCWQRTPAATQLETTQEEGESWLILGDVAGLGEALTQALELRSKQVWFVKRGTDFEETGERRFLMDPAETDHYDALFDELCEIEHFPLRILHLWSLESQAPQEGDANLGASSFSELASLFSLVQAVNRTFIGDKVQLTVITNFIQSVSGNEPVSPAKAMLLGACRVIPQEFRNIRCNSVDLELPTNHQSHYRNWIVSQLIAEMDLEEPLPCIAYRGRNRWKQTYRNGLFEADREQALNIRHQGHYLITGGLGALGLTLARHLAKAQVKLSLVGRSFFPARETHDAWLEEHGKDDSTSQQIQRLKELEELGAQVIVCQGDVGETQSIADAMQVAEARFGPINGVFHLAGNTSGTAFQGLHTITPAHFEIQFRTKVRGLLTLDKLLAERNADFCVLFSSIATILGGLGYGLYAAANHFMDAFARSRACGDTAWISIAWDGWNLNAESENALSAAKGMASLDRILTAGPRPNVIVATGDLEQRLARWVYFSEKENALDATYDRPELDTEYAPPSNEIERSVITIWEQLLGIRSLGINDNFFELGGDSLLATQMISRVRETFHVEIFMDSIFEAPTPAGVAAIVFEGSLQGTDEEELAQMLQELKQGDDGDDGDDDA